MIVSTQKKTCIFTLMLIAFGTNAVQAQTTTASSTDTGAPSIIENLSDRAADFRDRITEVREENNADGQSALSTRTQERITNLAANISNRFDAITDRLQNITDRLNVRIEKLSAEGTDTSTAKQSLDNAQAALDTARLKLNTIDEDVATVIGSTNPRAEWQTVRATFLSARDAIKLAHAELRNAIIQLKTAPPASAVATTTATEVPETDVPEVLPN